MPIITLNEVTWQPPPYLISKSIQIPYSVLKPALRYLAQSIRILLYTTLCHAVSLENRASNPYPGLVPAIHVVWLCYILSLPGPHLTKIPLICVTKSMQTIIPTYKPMPMQQWIRVRGRLWGWGTRWIHPLHPKQTYSPSTALQLLSRAKWTWSRGTVCSWWMTVTVRFHSILYTEDRGEVEDRRDTTGMNVVWGIR